MFALLIVSSCSWLLVVNRWLFFCSWLLFLLACLVLPCLVLFLCLIVDCLFLCLIVSLFDWLIGFSAGFLVCLFAPLVVRSLVFYACCWLLVACCLMLDIVCLACLFCLFVCLLLLLLCSPALTTQPVKHPLQQPMVKPWKTTKTTIKWYKVIQIQTQQTASNKDLSWDTCNTWQKMFAWLSWVCVFTLVAPAHKWKLVLVLAYAAYAKLHLNAIQVAEAARSLHTLHTGVPHRSHTRLAFRSFFPWLKYRSTFNTFNMFNCQTSFWTSARAMSWDLVESKSWNLAEPL